MISLTCDSVSLSVITTYRRSDYLFPEFASSLIDDWGTGCV